MQKGDVTYRASAELFQLRDEEGRRVRDATNLHIGQQVRRDRAVYGEVGAAIEWAVYSDVKASYDQR
jgi:hypothetical protein